MSLLIHIKCARAPWSSRGSSDLVRSESDASTRLWDRVLCPSRFPEHVDEDTNRVSGSSDRAKFHGASIRVVWVESRDRVRLLMSILSHFAPIVPEIPPICNMY